VPSEFRDIVKRLMFRQIPAPKPLSR